MQRHIPATFQDVLAGNNVPYVLYVEMEFDETLRVCSAGYNMFWGGYEWIGLGLLGSIETITEQATLEASTVNLTLSGVPADMVSISVGQQYQGKPCSIYIGLLEPDLSLKDTPVKIFQGRMDTMPMEVGEETATITLSVESRLVSWERARVRRYNHGDQIAKYPDDLGLEFVAQMVEKELKWG